MNACNLEEAVEPRIVSFEKGMVRLREDGIMHISIHDEVLIGKQDLEKLISLIGELGQQQKYPNLIEVGLHSAINSEARIYSATAEASRYTQADAFVVRSLAQRLLGNFYLKIDKPIVPTRFFNSVSQAQQWLMRFV